MQPQLNEWPLRKKTEWHSGPALDEIKINSNNSHSTQFQSSWDYSSRGKALNSQLIRTRVAPAAVPLAPLQRGSTSWESERLVAVELGSGESSDSSWGPIRLPATSMRSLSAQRTLNWKLFQRLWRWRFSLLFSPSVFWALHSPVDFDLDFRLSCFSVSFRFASRRLAETLAHTQFQTNTI